MSTNATVMIGVDGSSGSTAAVRYGAHEALRVGADIELVHVLHEVTSVNPMFPLTPPSLEEMGRVLLGRATEEVREIAPSVRVTATLTRGPRLRKLLAAAERASVVVLGHAQQPTFERLLTGSTVTPLAAAAPVTVVVVHPDWTPLSKQCVLVGVKRPERAGTLLRRAFEAAAQREARLQVIHAWELPNEYDELISSRLDESELLVPALREIQHAVDELQPSFPDVKTEVRIVHGQAAWVLREASEQTDLLVLARRRHFFPVGHLGGTLRALLRHSRCPVAVLPPAEHTDEVGLVPQQGGSHHDGDTGETAP